ncbi:MAG: Gfo/Idh/MocA family oxidoreductase [Planctomycetes bacterium]|nr:Gfo/Idh/MocA family oxidoreductase [Planctomycetota bacterium]
MPTKRHQVLIVGAGSIGERHLRCFQATGRAELAVVEIKADLRQGVAGRYGLTRTFADLDAALAQPQEVAVIATPAHLHIPMATRLAAAGVHLLIEKPLSTNLDGIGPLQEAIRARGVTVAVGYVYRCHPLLAWLKKSLAEARFGQPVELIAVSGQHFPTYRPAYRTTYYTDRASGGGAIQDALTHVVNAGEWLLGPIDRVVADAERQVLDGVTVEDTVHLLARHGPVLASYSLNQHQAPNEFTLTLVCERGTMRCEFHNHSLHWMSEPGSTWHAEAIPALERDTLFTLQANAFLDAVEGHAPAHCSLADGLQTLRVNLAALASVETRSWQVLSGRT